MKSYAPTSTTRPRVSDGRKPRAQAEFVYDYLDRFKSPCTLDQLIAVAEEADYESTFKRPGSTTVRESLMYHLNRFTKRGIVRIVEA